MQVQFSSTTTVGSWSTVESSDRRSIHQGRRRINEPTVERGAKHKPKTLSIATLKSFDLIGDFGTPGLLPLGTTVAKLYRS